MNDVPNESKHRADDSTAVPAQGKYKPLRVWPAVLLIVAMLAMVASRFLPAVAASESVILFMITIMAPLVLGFLILIWWLTFSRATILERIIGFLGTLIVAAGAIAISDKSVMGPAIMMVTIPMGTAAFAIGAILCRRQLAFKRTLIAVLLAALGFAFTGLLRSDGMWADGKLEWDWRWQSSAEENMLAQRSSMPTESLAEISESDLNDWLAQPEWPRFRGSDGLSQQHGPQIDVDWKTNAPLQLWKIAVGPGWSSFAVAGNLLYTQEQHGEQEAVVCYAADSGKEIWNQSVESRFEEPIGGPGPRATPTLANGRLFAQGATGQLLRLDPKTGDIVWSKDLRKLADREPPTWGFASSPLVVGSVVIVHAGGAGDKGTFAFDTETGDLKWSAPAGDHSYASPQLCTLDGKQYVLMLTNTGLNVLDPASGEQLLGYEWEYQGYRALQPQIVDGNSVLIPTAMSGTRLIEITASETGLAAKELWTSKFLKPDFNDFVVYENHAYGFDNTIFTCIDLATGERKWKGGRYGKGQVLLLADSGILLISSERGDVVLVKADPGGHEELAKFSALNGRTWNHPVVVGDRLYIRNAEDAACYQLPLAQAD